jgi:N-acetylglucosamine repressor
LGAGIILNGSIVRGGRGGAGEFGHTSVERAGIRCECGNIGCLENYVSWPAIYSRILSSIQRGRETAIMDLVEGDITRISSQVFIDALNLNDPLAMNITKEIASYLAAGMVNLVNLFNPDVIILGGDIAYNNDLLIESVNRYVSRHALHSLVDELKICPTSLGENAKLVGAASVLLQDVFRFKLST